MKIDKVIFTSSEEYSDFWNINSKIFRKHLDIEPVCFLFGKKAKTNISEEYGKVIEVEHNPSLHKLLQLTWFKFWYTSQAPDTTWMIGDIDQIPLQKYWFKENIIDMPESAYIHLNSTAISQNVGKPHDTWIKYGGELTGGSDLPAHYHIAKGSTFKKALKFNDRFEDDIRYIISAERYGLGMSLWKHLNRSDDRFYWCAEENYSSELIFNSMKNKEISLALFSYDNTSRKLDRSRMINGDYIYDASAAAKGFYVDIHCERPFTKQKNQLYKVLSDAWGCNFT